MKQHKRMKLARAGWKVGDAADFLDLDVAEASFVDLKLGLAGALRARRKHLGLSQVEAAKQLGSSQSRVAKMEIADESVSLDLLVRSLLKLGVKREALAKTVRGSTAA